MKRSTQQNKQLHTLIGKLNIDSETKQGLVYDYTNGRSKSSADMTNIECQALINNLNHIANQKVQVVAAPKPRLVKSAENNMRRKILSICHEMRWTINGQLDWQRINTFILKSGYLHKPLNKYTKDELPKLITQFEQVLKDFYAKR